VHLVGTLNKNTWGTVSFCRSSLLHGVVLSNVGIVFPPTLTPPLLLNVCACAHVDMVTYIWRLLMA